MRNAKPAHLLRALGFVAIGGLGSTSASAQELPDDDTAVAPDDTEEADDTTPAPPTAPTLAPATEIAPDEIEESEPSRVDLPPEVYDRRGRFKSRVVAPDGYESVPAPYVGSTRVHRGLVIGGGAALGGTWLLTSLVSCLGYGFSGGFPFQDGELDGHHLLGIVPVAGPFIVAGRQIAHGDFDGYGATLFGLGLGQIASAGILIAGLSTEQEIWVLDPKKVDSARVGLTFSPSLTGVRGSF